MSNKVEGNFSEALYFLIRSLVDMKSGKSEKSIDQLLYDWDKIRGKDWFIDTLSWEEDRERKQLHELKEKYE